MKRERAFWTLLVAFNVFLALLAIEFGYRYLFSEQHAYSVSTTGNQYHFYQFHSQLGWSNTPAVTGTYKREEFEYRISINKYGMRQHPVDKDHKASNYRIAVLGDSFVWGIGVNDQSRFTEILERLLPGSEVLNFGVSGYGPIQYYLLLDKVISFRPDLVILSFCLANDFEDNVFYERYGYYKPYATVDDQGNLIVKGHGFPNIRPTRLGTNETRQTKYHTMLGSKALAAIANMIMTPVKGGNKEIQTPPPQQAGLLGFTNALINTKESDLSTDELVLRRKAVQINEAILREIHHSLTQHDIAFILVSIPTKYQYNKSSHNGHEDFYLEAENILKHSAETLGIPFLANVQHLTSDDFWVKDGHWNLQGHQKIAKSIASFVPTLGFYKARMRPAQ